MVYTATPFSCCHKSPLSFTPPWSLWYWSSKWYLISKFPSFYSGIIIYIYLWFWSLGLYFHFFHNYVPLDNLLWLKTQFLQYRIPYLSKNSLFCINDTTTFQSPRIKTWIKLFSSLLFPNLYQDLPIVQNICQKHSFLPSHFFHIGMTQFRL